VCVAAAEVLVKLVGGGGVVEQAIGAVVATGDVPPADEFPEEFEATIVYT